jgi:hypothetical protein
VSTRGKDFLKNWLDKNVSIADRKSDKFRAQELAALCIADASFLGIALDDIQPEVHNVETIIYDERDEYRHGP